MAKATKNAKTAKQSASKTAKPSVTKAESKKGATAKVDLKPSGRAKKTEESRRSGAAKPSKAVAQGAPASKAESKSVATATKPGPPQTPLKSTPPPHPATSEPEKPKSQAAAATTTQKPVAQAAKPVQQAAAAAVAPPSAPMEPEEISELDGVRLPNSRGKVGVFGGPRDHSAKADDKLALPIGLHFQYERVRSLNGRSFYCAMRWDYRQNHMSPEEGKRWWANKRIVVTNPANGKSVVVRAVDYGPHENTGLAILISPGAAEALGVEVGGDVEMKFADQKAQLGPVQE